MAPTELPVFIATMSPADFRPSRVNGYSFPLHVGFHPSGRISQVPDQSFGACCPQSPRQAHWLLALVASPVMAGFIISGRLAVLKLASRGRIGFTCVTAHVFARRGFGHTDYSVRRPLRYLLNEQFAGCPLYRALDRPGLSWRTRRTQKFSPTAMPPLKL